MINACGRTNAEMRRDSSGDAPILFGDVALQKLTAAFSCTSAAYEINLENEIPMSLGGIETPGSTELLDVITVQCSRPGVRCVPDRDEADRSEACGVDVANFANLLGSGAVLRRGFAPGRDGPLVNHRFHRFRPPWPAASLVGVEGIEPAMDCQQRGQLARGGSTNRTPLTQHAPVLWNVLPGSTIRVENDERA